MTDIDRLFDDAFRTEGGRLTKRNELFDWYLERYRGYLALFKQHPLYRKALAATHFDFIGNKRLNACALHQGGSDLAAMFEGAVWNISALFGLLLSHPSFLRDVGDSGKEVPWFNDLSHCDWTGSLEKIVEQVGKIGPPPKDFPRDETRKRMMRDLATFALDFLFYHELGHIILGHLEYEGKQSGKARIDEVDRPPLPKPSHDHLIELNADSFAIGVTAAPFIDAKFFAAQPRTVFASADEALTKWATAVTVLFLAFDRGKIGVESYAGTSHPHPGVRMVNAYYSITGLASQVDRSSGWLGRIFKRAGRRVSRAWNAALQTGALMGIFKVPSAVWYVVDQQETELFATYGRLMDEWKTFQVQLGKYNRMKLA